MSAWLCISRPAPSASATVTSAGRASGRAAMANEMDTNNKSCSDSPRHQPRPKKLPPMISAAPDKRLPRVASRFCRGVTVSSVRMSSAILPSSVWLPVATT